MGLAVSAGGRAAWHAGSGFGRAAFGLLAGVRPPNEPLPTLFIVAPAASCTASGQSAARHEPVVWERRENWPRSTLPAHAGVA